MRTKKKIPIHIFVISSDKVLANNLVQNLESETDYTVFQNVSGEEFFNEITYNPIPEKTIPLIIVDYELKSMEHPGAQDGIEVLSLLKSNFPQWTVITISDYSMKKVKNESMQLGAMCHIFKNENTVARLKVKIQELENSQIVKRQKHEIYVALIVFVSLLAISSLIGFIMYFLEK